MPLNVSVTKRRLNNNKTGVDISVPSYQKADSPRNVKDYHVVVISRLPHFKLPQHSEEDVVQFMVPRDYDAFETLQKELLDNFSDLKLPSLPRKFHLFVSETDVEERQISFDCLLMLVARTPEMSTSISLLKFLGVDLIADKKYHKKRQDYLKAQADKKEQEKKRQEKILGTKEEEEVELFGGERSSGGRRENGGMADDSDSEDLFGEDVKRTSSQSASAGNKSLFEADTDRRARPKISLLNEDIEPTVLVGEDEDGKEKSASGKTQQKEERLFVDDEDHSELLDVTDSIDDILRIKAPSKKPKSKTSLRSTTKPTPSSLFEDDTLQESGTSTAAAAMGTDDIMKYIEQQKQTSADDDDLDLF